MKKLLVLLLALLPKPTVTDPPQVHSATSEMIEFARVFNSLGLSAADFERFILEGGSIMPASSDR